MEQNFYAHYHTSPTSIRGRLVDEEISFPDETRTVISYTKVPPELNKAISTLNIFRETNSYLSPCQQRPEMFDTQPVSSTRKRAELPSVYAERVRRASDICVSRCRAFVPCLAILAQLSVSDAEPLVTGVVAGTLLDPTNTGVAVRKVIEGNAA